MSGALILHNVFDRARARCSPWELRIDESPESRMLFTLGQERLAGRSLVGFDGVRVIGNEFLKSDDNT